MDKSERPSLDPNQVSYDANVARQTEHYKQPNSKMKVVLIILFFVIVALLVLFVLAAFSGYLNKVFTFLHS